MNGQPAVIRWEEPPPTKAHRMIQWAPIAEQLRTKPGVWALVFQGAYSDCVYLTGIMRNGSGPFAPKGSFEASQRRIRETSDAAPVDSVYGRYVPDERP